MYFRAKKTLKNNHFHIFKHPFRQTSLTPLKKIEIFFFS
jgi:hypothetical protein